MFHSCGERCSQSLSFKWAEGLPSYRCVPNAQSFHLGEIFHCKPNCILAIVENKIRVINEILIHRSRSIYTVGYRKVDFDIAPRINPEIGQTRYLT